MGIFGLILVVIGVLGFAELGPARPSRPTPGSGLFRGLGPTGVLGLGLGLMAIEIVLGVVFFVLAQGASGAEPSAAAVVAEPSDPGASYETERLTVGLALAGGLVAAAAVVLARTDWSPPGEADSRSIDDAAYADLDAEAAAFEARDRNVDA